MPVIKIMIMDEDEIVGIQPDHSSDIKDDFKFKYRRSNTILCEKIINVQAFNSMNAKDIAYDYFQSVTNQNAKFNQHRIKYNLSR